MSETFILSPIDSHVVLKLQNLSCQFLSLIIIISFSTQFFIGCTWPLSQASWTSIFRDNIVYSFIWWHQTFFCLKTDLILKFYIILFFRIWIFLENGEQWDNSGGLPIPFRSIIYKGFYTLIFIITVVITIVIYMGKYHVRTICYRTLHSSNGWVLSQSQTGVLCANDKMIFFKCGMNFLYLQEIHLKSKIWGKN